MLQWLVSVIPSFPLRKCKSPVQFSCNKLTNKRTYYYVHTCMNAYVIQDDDVADVHVDNNADTNAVAIS